MFITVALTSRSGRNKKCSSCSTTVLLSQKKYFLRKGFFIKSLSFSMNGLLSMLFICGLVGASSFDERLLSSFDESLLFRMCAYSFAAYQWPDSYQNIVNWNCSGCCGLLQGVSQVSVFVNVSQAAFGFVVGADQVLSGNKTIKTAVVAFRGTLVNDLTNWLEDLRIARTSPYKGNETVRVHKGFFDMYHSVRGQVRKLLLNLGAQQIFVTGHSLGAALAELCALDLVEDPVGDFAEVVHSITFGTPRVGNAAFSNYYASFEHFTSVRVVHWRDLVCHLPPRKWGWELTQNEVWYDNSFSRVLGMCQEPESKNCSDSETDFSITDHLSYFNLSHYHCKPVHGL